MSLLGQSAVDLLGVCLGRAGPAETVPGAALSPNELHFYVSAARVKLRVARRGFIFFANSSFLLSCRHFNNKKKKMMGFQEYAAAFMAVFTIERQRQTLVLKAPSALHSLQIFSEY